MDSTQAPAPTAIESSLPARIAWAVLIIATLGVCYFSHLGAIGFVGPDEPRYAWIARDMVETGDWVTPRLYGKPWFEKPPLYYWSAALSFKLFGISEAAARLPSALAALLATLALAWLAWRGYGAETARWLLLLLPTSVAMIGFSHAASTDMLFSATLTLALVAAAALLRLIPNGSSAPSASPASSTSVISPLFGLFLGLAVLAKGPAALVLLGGAVFFWAVFTKRWRDAFRLVHPAALAAFFLTALPWYVLCERRNPDFFRVFVIEHNFKRYLTPEFQHIQPFWYYGAVLLIALLPWTALFLWSTFTGALRLWRTRCTSELACLLLCWSAFCVLFFTVSKSKLPGYILPAIPAIALLFVRSTLSRNIPSKLGLRWTCWALSAVLFLTGVWLGPSRTHILDAHSLQQEFGAVLLLSLSLPGYFLGCSFVNHRSRWPRLSFEALAFLAVPLLVGFGGQRFLEFEDRDVSPRFLARQILVRNLGSGVSVHRLRRSDWYGLNFYLERDVPELQGGARNGNYVVTDSAGLLDLQRKGFRLQLLEFGGSPSSLSLYKVRTGS